MKDKISLSKEYKLNIWIEENNIPYAGKLTLTPEKISIYICGEGSDSREFPDIGHCRNLEKLVCYERDHTFTLLNLKLITGGWRTIQYSPTSIAFHEVEFEAECVFIGDSGCVNQEKYFLFNIKSESLNKWLGITNKPSEIQSKLGVSGSLLNGDIDTSEFRTSVKNFGVFSCDYDINIFYDITKFQSGTYYPPSFTWRLEKPQDEKGLLVELKKTYQIFSFLVGGDLDISEINLIKRNTRKSIVFYYPTKNKNSEKITILFPLGRNIQQGYSYLPELPLNLFESFYNHEKYSFIEKYNHYVRLQNAEERFLGFFRLLESMCYVEKEFLNGKLLQDTISKYKAEIHNIFNDKKNVNSFIKRIIHSNKTKYNTEKCLRGFLCRIPTEIKSNWSILESELSNICKLRNDITHANELIVELGKLRKYEKFIEVLFLLAFFESVDVPFDTTAQFIKKLNGYHFITH
ncbi:hypothetical protein NB069_00380 [Leclercia adecarboxylata]|uniref:hypothetical protein n=1 Tax=Leclercia adecarboxylata TaxID=83655 RepID=UPI00202A41E4|nr:hypothetical protein [Leclercia adecarboxylata]URN99388.1 hypothetical protein NB069_00380 [Leclercia adecarboxylata]